MLWVGVFGGWCYFFFAVCWCGDVVYFVIIYWSCGLFVIIERGTYCVSGNGRSGDCGDLENGGVFGGGYWREYW